MASNTLKVEQNAKLEARFRKAETGEQFAEVARLEAELLAAAVPRRPLRTVYPLYIASRAKKGLTAALGDQDGIIESVGEIQSLGNSRYAVGVTDHNGATYRVTIEHVADYDGPEGGLRY